MIGKDKQRGTWFVQYKFKDDLGKWHTTRKRGFKKKSEAVEYEHRLHVDKEIIGGNVTSTMTFKDVDDRYCDSKQFSKSDRERRNHALTKRFPYYQKPIKSITKLQLDDWRNKLANDDSYSTSTKNTTIGYVKTTFKYANDVYEIPNTASFIKRCKATDTEIMNKERPTWTVEQFNKFVDCVELPLFKIYFQTLYWTGMRRGECLALQKTDFDGKGLTVNKSIEDFCNGLKPTKTRNSRYITLPDFLCPLIQDVIDNTEDGDFIFNGERSLSTSSVKHAFNQARHKAGLDDTRVTIHCLRHSHATWLINNGVNIVAVSKRLGHSNIRTTLNEYTHLLKETDSKMMELINSVNKK